MMWNTNLALSAVLLLGQALANPLPEGSTPRHRKDARGAVASEVETCSQVGIDLMKKGGNAADAVSSSS